MTTHSPYILGNTVQDPAMFFGRAQELTALYAALEKGSSKAVVGLRRIGKSSLLYHLSHHATLPDHIAIAYLDLQDGRYQTIPQLLTGILQGIDRAVGGRYQFDPAPDMTAFAEAIERIKQDGYQPVICLDELEQLMIHAETFDRRFFAGWRALGSRGKLVFITASRVSINDVVQHNGKTSPFANIFTQLTLAGLDKTAVRALLTDPFRAAGRNVIASVYIEQTLPLVGRHPFFLQIGGDELWRNGAVNRKKFRRNLANAAKMPMTQLWQDLRATEQAAALRLATGHGAVPHWEDAQHRLLTIGLAEEDKDGQLRLFSDLLADWLKKGTFQQSADPRPLKGKQKNDSGKRPIPPPLQPTPKQETKPIYAYTLALLAIVVICFFIVLFLPLQKAAFFLALLLILFLALFVLMGKATVEQFLTGIDKALRGWFND
ncbi:MAG: ATP-binding protein [Chloroflexi bacterium]|nr:ATP-binding protein [Chloroflexota bacterium]